MFGITSSHFLTSAHTHPGLNEFIEPCDPRLVQNTYLKQEVSGHRLSGTAIVLGGKERTKVYRCDHQGKEIQEKWTGRERLSRVCLQVETL